MLIIDDYSRFIWVLFLAHKNEVFECFEAFCKCVEKERGYLISTIRSENKLFENFCNNNSYTHNFSTPRTPQQNGVIERKNRTLQDMA